MARACPSHLKLRALHLPTLSYQCYRCGGRSLLEDFDDYAGRPISLGDTVLVREGESSGIKGVVTVKDRYGRAGPAFIQIERKPPTGLAELRVRPEEVVQLPNDRLPVSGI